MNLTENIVVIVINYSYIETPALTCAVFLHQTLQHWKRLHNGEYGTKQSHARAPEE